MAPGEWRHGQSDRPWDSDADGAEEPSDLWGEDPASTWGGGGRSGGSWPTPGSPSQATPPPSSWPPIQRSPGQPPAYGQPWSRRPDDTDPPRARRSGGEDAWPGGETGRRRAGADPWSAAGGARAGSPTGRHSADDPADPPRRPPVRAARPPDAGEPSYGRVLGLTALWYVVPMVGYAVWLLTLSGDRRGTALRGFLAELPWVFSAVVLALVVAALLRWAVTGWRTLTLSFAAAIIGAGLITITHSFAQ